MKGKINEIGDTENGMYAIGQVAGRAYDRMLNSPRNKKSDGIVALDPKYGKVAQDAAYAGAGGYMQWRKKFKEKNRREPSYEEYRAWMQNYDNGVNDYGKPESERKGVVKLSESQLRSVIAESVKKVLKELEYNRNDGWFLYTEINNDGAEVLRISDNRGDFDYWRKNGGKVYGQYPSYEEAAKAMRYFAAKEGFRRTNGGFVK